MKSSDETTVFVPEDPVPCGDACVRYFWETASADDISIQQIKRSTLLNYNPSEPVSTSAGGPEIESTSVKDGSEMIIQPDDAPPELFACYQRVFCGWKDEGVSGRQSAMCFSL